MTPQGQLVGLSERDVKDGPLDLIRLCLFDWAVCAVAGRSEEVVRILANTGAQMSVSDVALWLGTMGHALDYDDTHFDHIGHTSSVVMPAILALAADQQISVATRVIEAALIGSEAAVRVGLWLGRDHYQIGFHQTATSGAIGATTGCARLLGLSHEKTTHAIGLAATAASGLKGQFGTMGKPLNAGLAARVGVEAALWAQEGMTSDASGVAQFGATHHGQADESAWDVSEPWKIARISHKFHACCHGLHAMLEALNGVSGDIAAVTIRTHPRWMTVCNKQLPESGLEVKFSYAMTAAMALSGVSTASIDSFSNDTAHDPRLIALRDKVRVVADEGLTEMQSHVTLEFANGRSEIRQHDLEVPLSLEFREKRLKQKARAVVGEDLSNVIWAAVQGGDVTALTKVFNS